MLRIKRMAITLVICLVVFIAVVAVSARLMENSLIYFPSKYPAGRWNPENYRLSVEDVWLTTEDNVRLHGWYAAAETAPGSAENGGAVPVILLFHGNGGNLTDRMEKLKLLTGLGADVFIIDYRGYGKSEGRPDEAGIYRDGTAAYEYLTSEREVAPERVILYGESLGGAVACELAQRFPVGGVILESAFTRASDMARKLLPLLPPQLYLQTRFDNLGKIARITAPVLILHGAEDTTVPPSHARRLYAATGEPKTLVLIPGAEHNDVFVVGEEEYTKAIAQLLGRSPELNPSSSR